MTKMKTTTKTKTKTRTKTAAKTKTTPWPRFPGAPLLKSWAADLKSACAAADEAEWRDVGRAVILVVASESQAEESARRVAVEAGMRFIAIDAAGMKDLPPHAELLKHAPAMVWLEPDEWMEVPLDEDTPAWAEEKQRIQEQVAAWVEAFDSRSPVVVVTACDNLNNVSGAIDRPGIFDRYLALPPKPLEQLGEEFIDDLGAAAFSDALRASPAKLGKWVEQECESPRRRKLALLYLRRLGRREQRPLEFLDLMHLATHGYVEEAELPTEDDEIRRSIAAHEAGHAAMAILDSKGKNIPDYCSIVPGTDFLGVVTDSIAYRASLGERTTYADFRHRIRIRLAGRAAEELAYGPESISTGAGGDLASASKRAFTAFGQWGFAPDMTSHEQASGNLGVVLGDPTPTERARLEGQVRAYLAREYRHVYQVLEENRPLVDAIADRLMSAPIIDQEQLLELSRQHGCA
jgi:cell division protease FtsH